MIILIKEDSTTNGWESSLTVNPSDITVNESARTLTIHGTVDAPSYHFSNITLSKIDDDGLVLLGLEPVSSGHGVSPRYFFIKIMYK